MKTMENHDVIINTWRDDNGDGGTYIYNGGPVTRQDKKRIRSVIVPNHVIKIANQAFERCKFLETVQFFTPPPSSSLSSSSSSATAPSSSSSSVPSLREIGTRAFLECSSLYAITLPSTVEIIGKKAFFRCHNLICLDGLPYISSTFSADETALPSRIRVIEKDAFCQCHSLQNIDIPASLRQIGMYAFARCHGLNTVTFEEENDQQQEDQQEIEETTIRNCLLGISDGAFYECWKLQSIVLPNSLKVLGRECFADCTMLSDINLPTSLEVIGKLAFSGCTNLDSAIATLPPSVKEIGTRAFETCAVQSLELFGSGKSKDRHSSSCSCSSSCSSSYGLEKLGNYAFFDCFRLRYIKIHDLPTTLTTTTVIGKYAFADCHSLQRVELPRSITTIPEGLFAGCTNLTSINLSSPSDDATTEPQEPRYNDQQEREEHGYYFRTSQLIDDSDITNATPPITNITFCLSNNIHSIATNAFDRCDTLHQILNQQHMLYYFDTLYIRRHFLQQTSNNNKNKNEASTKDTKLCPIGLRPYLVYQILDMKQILRFTSRRESFDDRISTLSTGRTANDMNCPMMMQKIRNLSLAYYLLLQDSSALWH